MNSRKSYLRRDPRRSLSQCFSDSEAEYYSFKDQTEKITVSSEILETVQRISETLNCSKEIHAELLALLEVIPCATKELVCSAAYIVFCIYTDYEYSPRKLGESAGTLNFFGIESGVFEVLKLMNFSLVKSCRKSIRKKYNIN